VSDDAVHWQRPWRDLDAQGGAPYTIEAPPVFVGGRMVWWINNQVCGLATHRIAGISAQSGAAFTTRPFQMPTLPLRLNTAVSAQPRCFDQGCGMAELLDEHWVTVPGYEAENCLLCAVDDTALPLLWIGSDGTKLAGQTVAVRFSFRGGYPYSLQSEV
jgi:hypothetical protein